MGHRQSDEVLEQDTVQDTQGMDASNEESHQSAALVLVILVESLFDFEFQLQM